MRSPVERLSSSFTGIGSSSSWFEVYAAFSTLVMLLRTAINDLIPHQIRNFIFSKLKAFFSNSQPNNQVSLHIEQFWDGTHNQLFYAAKEYLPTKITHTYKSLRVAKLPKNKNILVVVDGNQVVVDQFEDIELKWNLIENSNTDRKYNKKYEEEEEEFGEKRRRDKNGFVLSFDEKHRDKVMKKYIPHVLRTYEAMKVEQKTLKIHSMKWETWKQSDLTHPASFNSLALDPELKHAIIDDLDRFLRRKEFYKKVGKPWKRGYLLHGPPGTGKSSLIAAMANYLKFDVYDLELSSMSSNSNLMRSMRETSNRSIIVIEDIDCNKEVLARSTTDKDSDSIKVCFVLNFFLSSIDDKEKGEVEQYKFKLYSHHRSHSSYVYFIIRDRAFMTPKSIMHPGFTLSGLLNYMDGLWTCCGEERIMIFTTNHKDRVDPALLRPGRMDMHIHLSFLKTKAFRILASNYLDIEGHDHPLFEQIEELLEKIEVTPAVVAEQLLRSEDPDVALEALTKFLNEINFSRVLNGK